MAGNANSGRKASQAERDFSELIKKSYLYLCNNFHKFKPNVRFNLALEIIKKAMPTAVEHSGNMGGETKIIIIRPSEVKVEDTAQTVSRPLPVQSKTLSVS